MFRVKVPMEYTPVLIFFEIALLGFAHYIPHWKALTGKPIEHPSRLQFNYAVGVACIFLPFTIWLRFTFENGMATYEYVASWMWVFIVSGGFAVWLMYMLDGLVERLTSAKNQKEINDILRKNQDAEQKRQ